MARDGRDEMCTSDVEIGEVCTVRFMEVVISFKEWRVRWCDEGCEKGARWEWCGLEKKVVNEGAEESNLFMCRLVYDCA